MGEWEPVYAFVEWVDGPRSGIAQVNGQPCVYDSDWADMEGDEPGEATFHLMPITTEQLATVMAVLQDQRAHPNWGEPRGGELTSGTKYPHLMADSSPFGPVWWPLITALRSDPGQWPRLAATFRPCGYPEDEPYRLRHSCLPLEARWSEPVETGS